MENDLEETYKNNDNEEKIEEKVEETSSDNNIVENEPKETKVQHNMLIKVEPKKSVFEKMLDGLKNIFKRPRLGVR